MSGARRFPEDWLGQHIKLRVFPLVQALLAAANYAKVHVKKRTKERERENKKARDAVSESLVTSCPDRFDLC